MFCSVGSKVFIQLCPEGLSLGVHHRFGLNTHAPSLSETSNGEFQEKSVGPTVYPGAS